MSGPAQRRRVQLGAQDTTPCCTDTRHAQGSHSGGSSFGQDFRPYARVRGGATLGVSGTPAQQQKPLEDALASRVDEDRPVKPRPGRSIVVALAIGFVLSVTGFAFFTAWLIREA